MIQKTGGDRSHWMIASAQTARAGRAEIRLRIMSTVRAPALDAPLDAPFGAAGFVSPGAPTGGFAPMSTWASPAFCRAKSALQNIFQRKTPSLSLRLSVFASGETSAILRTFCAVPAQNRCRQLRPSAPCCANQEVWLRNIERQNALMAHFRALPPHHLAIHSHCTATATHAAARQSLRATTI